MMFHYFIGNFGHLIVITSFVTALVSSYSYWKANRVTDSISREGWIQNGRAGFILHSAAVLGIIISLFTIIYSHYFEYHYAYSHSSLHLPGQYMISCFWEGQEGSFLLWMFWQAIIGIILITAIMVAYYRFIDKKNKYWPYLFLWSLLTLFILSFVIVWAAVKIQDRGWGTR